MPTLGRTSRQFFFVIGVALLTACRTPPPPPLAEGGVERSGQVAYRGATTLVAEFVLRQSGGDDFDLELFKGVGAPLFTVRVVHGEVWADGAMRGRSWHGHEDRVPEALTGWVGLADVFARLPATDTPGWKIEATRTGAGECQRLRAACESSGETFDFRFD
jgi:hypothetical protein